MEVEFPETECAKTVRAMLAEDGPAVLAIYAEGIAGGNATFETAVPSWHDWDAGHLAAARLVVAEGDRVVGWSALAPVSGRHVYRGVADISTYVAASARGRGVGGLVLSAAIAAAEAAGFWTLQAGIFPENAASLALHARHGFRELGVRQRIGLMSGGPFAGHWRDVVLMERRSAVAGC